MWVMPLLAKSWIDTHTNWWTGVYWGLVQRGSSSGSWAAGASVLMHQVDRGLLSIFFSMGNLLQNASLHYLICCCWWLYLERLNEAGSDPVQPTTEKNCFNWLSPRELWWAFSGSSVTLSWQRHSSQIRERSNYIYLYTAKRQCHASVPHIFLNISCFFG